MTSPLNLRLYCRAAFYTRPAGVRQLRTSRAVRKQCRHDSGEIRVVVLQKIDKSITYVVRTLACAFQTRAAWLPLSQHAALRERHAGAVADDDVIQEPNVDQGE